MWKTIADRYNELWNLPNCVGSIDGKHIRIKAPVNSGSSFFNYKGYFSIVLMATADADGKFITIDVGEYGRNSDSKVFKESAFGQLLFKKKLNLPENACLPHEENDPTFPYYFVADEAFPLLDNVMRPYPRRSLTNTKRIFNYRLSNGRKSVECAFGMMASKFRILERPINFKTEKIEIVIKAICVLHNLIRVHDAITADVAKMYRQVFMSPDDSELQRILYRASPDQPLKHYKLKTVTYGTKSASFLATRCL
ncbi:protein ANTAGONIST OF LIKE HETEROCHROMATIN PROTEIN 1-like, partial [Acyrthosiphon pisum]|uniref:DDE Tnp4 domain-containing protein n=1 Tax=Acyrthosiphon pisum TaxID=7029 RepID=A0A8R2B9K7_ACYPI